MPTREWLGYTKRPYDPKQEQYHISKVWRGLDLDVTTVQVNVARSLANFNGVDCRVPITNQGPLGACASFASVEAAQMAATGHGWLPAQDPPLNYGLVYEMARQKEQSFPQDAGSDPMDCLGFILGGVPLDKDMPYTAQAATDYRSVQGVDIHKYIAGYSAFQNSKDQLFLQNICQSLDLGHPVIIGGTWYDSWFNPGAYGDLPIANPTDAVAGGHAFALYSRLQLPDGRWGFGCPNHWTPGWNPQATNAGLRAGDFIITDDMLMLMCWEAITIVGANAPGPNPSPNPQPTPGHYTPVGDTVPFWNFIKQYPVYFQNAMDIWGPQVFHPRGCA